jgi:hypothetical protein
VVGYERGVDARFVFDPCSSDFSVEGTDQSDVDVRTFQQIEELTKHFTYWKQFKLSQGLISAEDGLCERDSANSIPFTHQSSDISPMVRVDLSP